MATAGLADPARTLTISVFFQYSTSIARAIRLNLFLATQVWTNFAQFGPNGVPERNTSRTESRLAGSQ